MYSFRYLIKVLLCFQLNSHFLWLKLQLLVLFSQTRSIKENGRSSTYSRDKEDATSSSRTGELLFWNRRCFCSLTYAFVYKGFEKRQTLMTNRRNQYRMHDLILKDRLIHRDSQMKLRSECNAIWFFAVLRLFEDMRLPIKNILRHGLPALLGTGIVGLLWRRDAGSEEQCS